VGRRGSGAGRGKGGGKNRRVLGLNPNALNASFLALTTGHQASSPAGFALEFHNRVNASLRQQGLAANEELASQYIISILESNGEVPEGLHPKAMRACREIFARLCVRSEIPEGTYPGQSLPWFQEVFETAQRRAR